MSTGTATAMVNVSVQPGVGSGPTEFGIFNISVAPVRSSDQILNLQYIVSVEGQQPGAFASFVYIGNLEPGQGFPVSQFYASCRAVMANRQGSALTVLIVGAVNNVSNVFEVPFTFDGVLWPQGSCD